MEPRDDAGPGGTPAGTDRLNDRSDYQRCFACGAHNPHGLGLQFRPEGDAIVADFVGDERFQGFPGYLHGGILATLLDETLERVGVLEGRWLMTGRLELRYRRAAPLGRPLRVSARPVSSRARALVATAELRLADEPDAVIAEAQGTFLPLPAELTAQIDDTYPRFLGMLGEPAGGEPTGE
jgi:acyl-coenzyme A thioesterase PaaI-like protein